MNRFSRLIFAGVLSIAALNFAPPVYAACSSPAGVEGEQFYNTTHDVMQFCNGDDWVNMAGAGGGGLPTDCADGDTPRFHAATTSWLCESAAEFLYPNDAAFHFAMEQASGNLTSSVGALVGTPNGTITYQSAGKHNYAITQDAAGEYISIAGSPMQNASYSITAWIYLTSAPASWGTVYNWGATSGCPASRYFSVASTRKLNAWTSCGTPVQSTGLIPLNTWTFVALTIASNNDTAKLYINGSLDGSGSIGSIGNTGNDKIGAAHNGGSIDASFPGRFDEVTVWKKELSAAEVAQLYNGGAGLYP